MKAQSLAHVSVLLSMFNAACAPTAPSRPGQNFDIKAPNGVILKASYYSPGAGGPAILLIHQCSADRRSWGALVDAMADAGWHVLTYDQRGFGESEGKRSGPEDDRHDADAAFAQLLSLPNVDRTRMAAGGSSCGVGESVDLASRHPEIKALVELSGGASPAGLKYVAATPGLPIYGAGAEHDPLAADLRGLVAASRHPKSSATIYPDFWLNTFIGRQAHGVVLFDRHPELVPNIVRWLGEQVR